MPALLSIERAGFSYNHGTSLAREILSNVTFSVQKGEFVGLIGPTGSGKSTLVQLFNGLLAPSAGRVLLKGREIGRDIQLREACRLIGLVFQFPESQLFEETVFADVAFAPRSLGLSETEVEQRVHWALAAVGLEFSSIRDRSPFSLSGGEMRRVAIAGILAMKPEFLVLDEPTAGLDGSGRGEILGYLKELHEKGELTVLMVSHDLDELAPLVDRVLLLAQGRIIRDDKPSRVLTQAQELLANGLAVPQVTALMLALRQRGLDVPVDVFDVEAADAAIQEALEGDHFARTC